MSDGRRGKRVAEDIREHLADIFRAELSDPRLTALVVTTVRLSADLGLADVSVRSLVEAASAREQQAVTRALAHAAGRLRHLLGVRLNMKRMPQLRFHYDTAPEARERVDRLLEEIRRDDEARPSVPASSDEARSDSE